MSEVSIAEAKNHLPRVVQQAEAGETIHITRRGKPVAVLISDREFARLSAPRQGFTEFAQEWRKNMIARGIEFPTAGELDNLRDNSARPDISWD
jgi:prevent-host-death family protein